MRIFLVIVCSFVLLICLIAKRTNANFRGGSIQYSAPSRSYSSDSYRAPVYSAPARTFEAPIFRSPPTNYVVRSPPSYNPAPLPSGNVRIRDSIPSPSPGNSAPVSSGSVRSRPDVLSGGDQNRPSVSRVQRPSSVPITTGSAGIPSVVSRPLPPVSGFYILHRDQASSDSGLRRRLPPYYVPSGEPAEISKASTVVERPQPAPQKPDDSGSRDRQVQNPRPLPIIPKLTANEKLRTPSEENKPPSAPQNVARRPGPDTSKETKPFHSAKDLLRKPDGKPNMISRDSSKNIVTVDQNILLSRLKVNSPEAVNEMNDLIRTRPNDAQNVVSRVSAQELAALIAAGSKNNKDKEQYNKRQRDDEKDNKRVRDKDGLHKRLKGDEKNVLKKDEKKGKSEKKEEKADNIRTRPPLPGSAVTKPPGTDQTIPPCNNDCATPVPPRPTIPYPRTTTPIYQQWLHYYCWNYQTPGYPYCFDYFNIGSTGAGGALRASGASCPVTQFECANAHCVYRSQLCNGRNDCKDNSDEGPLANCSAKKVAPLIDKTGKRPGNETSMLLATADQLAKLVAAGNQRKP